MRDNGQTISVLAPFSVSFYRYFGWELFLRSSIIQSLKLCFPLGKQVDVMKRMSFEWLDPALFQMIKDFHNAQAIIRNGGMVRDEGWWKRLERRSPDSHFAAYFQGSNIEGYIRYTIRDGAFTIQDFVVANLLAEQAMWRYMTSHAASVSSITGVTSNHYPLAFISRSHNSKGKSYRM